MTMNSDAKFKEKLTTVLKYDMRNLVNFDSTTQKSESFCRKYMRFEIKKNTGNLS